MKFLIFSTHSMKYIWYSPQKSKYPLCICLLCLFQRRICVRATFSQCISVRATLFQRGCCCDHLTSSTRLRKEQTLYRYCALLDIMPSYSILHKIVFIRPFGKRSYYVIPLGVRPSVCKLFRFRVTPPTVYVRLS